MARSQQQRDEADQKFWALREAGYTGGIDQDGNKDNRYEAAWAKNHDAQTRDKRK